MYKSVLVTLLAATAIIAAPATVQRRTPSDTSGKAYLAFRCSSTTLPNPGTTKGTGEGGEDLYSTDFFFVDESGTKHGASACYQFDVTEQCVNCLFEGGGLSSATNVTACSNQMAGHCNIQFEYNGYDFDTTKNEPYCGHTNKLEPFGDTKVGVCYFNVTGTAS